MDRSLRTAQDGESRRRKYDELVIGTAEYPDVHDQAQSPFLGGLPVEVRSVIYKYMGIHRYKFSREWSGYVLSCRKAYLDIEEEKRHEFRVYMLNWDVWQTIVARSAEFEGTIDYEVRLIKFANDKGSIHTLVLHMDHPFRVVEALIPKLTSLPFEKMVIVTQKSDSNPLPVWTHSNFQDRRIPRLRRRVASKMYQRLRMSASPSLRTSNIYFILDGVSRSPGFRFLEKWNYNHMTVRVGYMVPQSTDWIEELE